MHYKNSLLVGSYNVSSFLSPHKNLIWQNTLNFLDADWKYLLNSIRIRAIFRKANEVYTNFKKKDSWDGIGNSMADYR